MEGRLLEQSDTIDNSAFTMRESRLRTSGSQDKKRKGLSVGQVCGRSKTNLCPFLWLLLGQSHEENNLMILTSVCLRVHHQDILQRFWWDSPHQFCLNDWHCRGTRGRWCCLRSRTWDMWCLQRLEVQDTRRCCRRYDTDNRAEAVNAASLKQNIIMTRIWKDRGVKKKILDFCLLRGFCIMWEHDAKSPSAGIQKKPFVMSQRARLANRCCSHLIEKKGDKSLRRDQDLGGREGVTSVFFFKTKWKKKKNPGPPRSLSLLLSSVLEAFSFSLRGTVLRLHPHLGMSQTDFSGLALRSIKPW